LEITMNIEHIKLIRKVVKELIEASLSAEVACMYPPEEARFRRLELRMAKAQYTQMLKEFEGEIRGHLDAPE
jgi:hypothetical protein